MPTATGPMKDAIDIKAPLEPQEQARLPRLIPRKKKESPPQNPLPVPETPPLPTPPDRSSLSFATPTRRILSSHDHDLFLASSTYSLVVSFVFSLSESATNKKLSSLSSNPAEPSISGLLSILDRVEDLIRANPPEDQGGSRFGNPAFRSFIDSIASASHDWHQELGLTDGDCISETSAYLHQAFGNRARIDYGSGHELNFVIWLLCLNRLSILPPSTFSALVLRVFTHYIRLLRKIQSTYYLEPAGSHGVWGLDDYHFLPFLFGASQLLHHAYIRPLAIHNEVTLEEEGDEYMYLDMVRFTVQSKSVKGLKWTQPMLDDISGAKDWVKVEQGMRRMFVKEVLGKLPVMQHFLFGSLVPAVEGMQREGDVGVAPESEEMEGGALKLGKQGPQHAHDHNGPGDCCGIKVPSALAASQEERRRGEGLRRLPFD